MTAIDAAELVSTFRNRVTVQNVSQVSDGQGGFTETWPDGNTFWASIEPLKGYEKIQAMQMQSPNTHKIKMRYNTEVTTSSRLVFNDRVFWVKEVLDPEERKRFLFLMAIERS